MTYDAPDHYAIGWPSRSTLGENQSRYMYTTAGSIAGGGGTGYLDITSPTGYNMIVSYISVESPVSCIQYMYVQIDATTLFHKYYDISCFLPFPTEGAIPVPEGSTLSIYITNNDASAQTLRISLGGIYEEV